MNLLVFVLGHDLYQFLHEFGEMRRIRGRLLCWRAPSTFLGFLNLRIVPLLLPLHLSLLFSLHLSFLLVIVVYGTLAFVATLLLLLALLNLIQVAILDCLPTDEEKKTTLINLFNNVHNCQRNCN